MNKLSQEIAKAEVKLGLTFLTTAAIGSAGNLLLNPFPTALKNIATLGLDFTLGRKINQKPPLHTRGFSLCNAVHVAGTFYFAYHLFEEARKNPFNPQIFCDITSVILHAGSLYFRNRGI